MHTEGRLPLAVIAACAGDTTAMAVFAGIDAGISQQQPLAELIGVDPGTIRRAVKRLRDRELVTGNSREGFVLAHAEPRVSARAPARGDVPEHRASARATGAHDRASARGAKRPNRASARGASRARDLLSKESLVTREQPPAANAAVPDADVIAATLRARAREITDAVWKQKDPKPATPYIGVVKIAERFVAAGWPDADIIRAMVAAPTISTGWVEADLNRRHARPVPVRPIDMDRDGPRGKVQL